MNERGRGKRPELPPGDRRSIGDDGEFRWRRDQKRRVFARKVKRRWNQWTSMEARPVAP